MEALAAGALIFALALFGGGNGSSLGAGQDVVTSCDTSVAASFATSYDEAARAYVIDTVTLSGVDPACDGGGFSVTLAAVDGRRLAQASGILDLDPGSSAGLDFSADDIPAGDVGLIAVSIGK